ncbi:MAG: prepilin-type N-terminal cleavage/methylation domain-containing protein [Candidatus Binatia bacterium]
MMGGLTVRGFTLVELLVALVLLSVAALGLTTTLISTHRALRAGEQWMEATQLAAEGIEQLRAGQIPAPAPSTGAFDRVAVMTPWDGHFGLQRLEVTVSWNDGERHTFQLVTLARR